MQVQVPADAKPGRYVIGDVTVRVTGSEPWQVGRDTQIDGTLAVEERVRPLRLGEEVAREALRLAMHKLPCKCKIVSRADLEGGDNSEN